MWCYVDWYKTVGKCLKLVLGMELLLENRGEHQDAFKLTFSEKFILCNDDKYHFIENLCLWSYENQSESFRYYYLFHQNLKSE